MPHSLATDLKHPRTSTPSEGLDSASMVPRGIHSTPVSFTLLVSGAVPGDSFLKALESFENGLAYNETECLLLQLDINTPSDEIDTDTESTDVLDQISAEIATDLKSMLPAASDVSLKNIIRESLASKFPEVSAIAAVKELRAQFGQERKPARERLEGRPRYSASESGLTSLDFLLKHYGEELREGSVGPGQIQTYDINLYHSLRRLIQKQPPGQPSTMPELFAAYAEHDRSGSAYQRRLQACAEILDTDEAKAAKFLASIRPERVKQREEIQSRML